MSWKGREPAIDLSDAKVEGFLESLGMSRAKGPELFAEYRKLLQAVLRDFLFLVNDQAAIVGALGKFNAAFAGRDVVAAPSAVSADVAEVYPHIDANLWPAPAVTDHARSNFYKMLQHLDFNTTECRRLHNLTYHTVKHIKQVGRDTSKLFDVEISVDASLTPYKLLSVIAAYMHDSRFERKRCIDETDSANLVIRVLGPFLDDVAADDPAKLTEQESSILKALVRLVIMAGTTPLFARGMMTIIWREAFAFLKQQVPEGEFDSDPFINQIGKICRMVADADVQRTLIPGLEAGDHAGTYAEEAAMRARVAGLCSLEIADPALSRILARLMQSTSFACETPPSAAGAESESFKVKFARRQVGDGVDLSEEDVAGLLACLPGEAGFAEVVLRGLRTEVADRGPGSVRTYDFDLASLERYPALFKGLSEIPAEHRAAVAAQLFQNGACRVDDYPFEKLFTAATTVGELGAAFVRSAPSTASATVARPAPAVGAAQASLRAAGAPVGNLYGCGCWPFSRGGERSSAGVAPMPGSAAEKDGTPLSGPSIGGGGGK